MHPSLLSQFDLSGKTALVTGASRGLGISFARGLAKANCNLVIAARDLDRLTAVASDLEQYGVRVVPMKADVAQTKDAEAMVQRALNEFGHLDILVNNAGISAVAEAEVMSSTQWQSVIDTNLSGLFYCAQSAARQMLRAGAGKIINIASMYGIRDFFPGKVRRCVFYRNPSFGRVLDARLHDVVLGLFRAGPDVQVLAIVPHPHRDASRLLPERFALRIRAVRNQRVNRFPNFHGVDERERIMAGRHAAVVPDLIAVHAGGFRVRLLENGVPIRGDGPVFGRRCRAEDERDEQSFHGGSLLPVLHCRRATGFSTFDALLRYKKAKGASSLARSRPPRSDFLKIRFGHRITRLPSRNSSSSTNFAVLAVFRSNVRCTSFLSAPFAVAQLPGDCASLVADSPGGRSPLSSWKIALPLS
jgi:NAD(P)-dependent dehydrogenase (short-subunit alcohol dehydrogenase family)